MERVRDAGRVSHRLNLLRNGFGARALLARIKRRTHSRAQTAHALGVFVDALENRTLLSTLPAPITTDTTAITGALTTNNQNFSSPSIAYDPLDPMKVVAVFTKYSPSGADQQSYVMLSYSTNGGATWSAPTYLTPATFPIDTNNNTVLQTDLNVLTTTPTTPSPHFRLAEATDANVAFDRNNNVYVVWDEHSASYDTGEIVESKFDFSGNSINALGYGNNPATIYRHVVYTWADYWAAVNPTLAVDDNLASYTDQNNVVTTDPGSGNVYVAWNTQYFPPPGTPTPAEPPFNPHIIQITGSSDGGNSFSTPVDLDQSPFINTVDAFPKIAISQGGTNNPNVTPGQVTVIWQDYGRSAPQTVILSDALSSITSNTIQGADSVSANIIDDTGDAIPNDDGQVPAGKAAPIEIDFDNLNAGNVSYVSLNLAIIAPQMNELYAYLEAPDGKIVNLFLPGVSPTGQTIQTTGFPAQGLSGTNLGVDTSGIRGVSGTMFVPNPQSPNPINSGSGPWIDGAWLTEHDIYTNQDLSNFAGHNGQGIWKLFVGDNDPTTVPSTEQAVALADLTVTSGLHDLTGNKTVGSTYVSGNWIDNNEGGSTTDTLDHVIASATPSATIGIDPGAVITSDNTLGTFAEYQGRLYVAYVLKGQNDTTNTNIALAFSDNGGMSWSSDSTKVNDDLATTDGYSGDAGTTSDRTQFAPAIAVDNANGTLVMTWYDARYDASNARVARFITTSLDGGSSFGGQTYLNQPNQVYNAITGQAVDLGPIPDNFSAGNEDSIFAEGASQGLAAFDGRVYAAWSGNENGGPQGNITLNILTSSTTYSSGPRVVSSTQGVVSTPEDILNPAQNVGSTIGTVPAFQYIDITFDRPIDPSTFSADDVTIQYRNTSTPGSQPPTADLSSLVSSIIPLDLQFWGGGKPATTEAATEFRIALSAPQTAVGTYTYSISPSVTDGYQYYGLSGTSSTVLTASALDPSQVNLIVPKVGNNSTSSSIVVPNSVAANQTIVDVKVNVNFNGAIDALSQYVLTLVNVATGVSVTLASAELGASQNLGAAVLLPDLAGHGYVSTTFDDDSNEPNADGNFQFSGTYHPTGNLAAFNGISFSAGDTWQLAITSSVANSGSIPTGLLRDWSLQFQTETLQTDDTLPATNGNVMDQNGDAIPSQPASFSTGFQTIGDVWAMPTPASANSYTSGSPNYFTAPFVTGTSAIIVPGPSVQQYLSYPASVGGGGVAIPSTAGSVVTSTLTITDPSYITISDLIVKLQITYPKDNDLIVQLISPFGTPITLVDQPPVTNATAKNPNLSDANLGDSILGPTVFTDDATDYLSGVNSRAPYVGLYKPSLNTPLSNLDGESLAGTWTLQITNVGGSAAGTLNSWSLEAGTEIAPTDTSISSINVTFDRNMDPSTINNADVISIIGPLGALAGPFTITPDYNADPNFLNPDQSNPRTYTIGFPTQTLTGTYVVTLASTIESASYTLNSATFSDVPLDTDQNAGVDLLNDTGGSANNVYPGSGSSDGGSIPPHFTNNGVFTSTISVPVSDAGLLQGVLLTLNLNTNHGTASDLSAVLISPQGLAIQLFGNLNHSTVFTGLDTTFEDISTISINSAANGYNGTYTPQQPLSSLLDSNSAGTWTLVIKNVGANTYTLNDWSLSLTTAAPDSGVGSTVADNATISFKLFNMGPTDAQSHEVWTPVGGTVNTGSNSTAGPVTAIAVDPTDPSGNTVFIGAATGGVWKTTNFLTTDPNGPTYVSLISNAPTNGLNIGSIAVLGSQINPATSGPADQMIFAATGNGNTNTLSPGIGILVSEDDGATWNIATGLNNYNSTTNKWLDTSAGARDNTFVGLTAYKIVVDPHLQADGDAIIYVAFSDPSGNGKGGIYRSIDSGKTWTLMRAGQATDVILEQNSAIPSFNNSDVDNPTQNVNAIEAAFANDGVYRSDNRGITWTEMLGTNPDTNILDYSNGIHAPVNVASTPSPDGDNGRIVLAAPALTGNPTEDVLYEGWLYAAVISQNNLNNPSGTLVGLYMTKDYGATWTKVQIDGRIINGVVTQNPTDDTTQDPYDVTNGTGIPSGDGNYAIALSVDPTNPNVVYLAGSAYANYAAGMIRVDTTGISDAHALYQGENAPDGGQLRVNTTDVAALKNWYNSAAPSVGAFSNSVNTPTINLLTNPSEPFSTNTSVATTNIADLSNSGANVTWLPFDSAFDYTNGNTLFVTTPSEYHEIISEIDPATGLSRLIIATDQGVYSAVDAGDGTFRVPDASEQNASGGIGIASTNLNEPASGSRNGNLQIAELYYGAVQPSQAAASAAGSLFYGEGQGVGLISSASDVLTSGNTNWTGATEPSGGVGVATDQTGTGTVYNYAAPFWSQTYTDFFQVNGNSRTSGLLTTGTDGNTTHDAEWPDFLTNGNGTATTFGADQSAGSSVVVNPINNQQIVMSSHPTGDAGAQIFATTNQGRSWSVIGNSADLDDSYAPALAYGAPATNVAEGNFIYAGTDNGNIYVTFTGGGSGATGNKWINISSGLDGSPVESIITDPNHNTFDAFAVTQKGVYFMADSSAASPSWVKITSNLLNITQTAFNNSNYVQNAVQMLTSMVADWRYATPVLYVGANAGVYRGVKNGSTWSWSAFPDASDGAAQDGGYLPNVEVSDLDLAVGNVNPATGLPVTQANDPDSLVASTFGDGAYAIRLAPVISNAVLAPMSDTGTSSTDDYTKDQILTFTGNSEELISGFNSAHIGIYLINSDGSTTYLGGFDGTLGDASDTLANQTDPSGNFSVTTTVPLPANGTFTIGLRATDNAGVTGAFTKINVTIATTPPTINTFTLTAATDSGTTVGGVYHTNVNPPAVQGTVINESAPTQSEQGTIVSIYLDSNLTTPIGTAVVDANNDFTFTLPAALSQGNHTITAIATDPVGNVSASTSLTVDIITSIATPSAPTLATASDSGVSNSDDLTKVTQPTFTGTAAAGDTVTLLINGNTTTDTAVADTNGNYSITVPSSLGADGTYAITVTQTDLADNVSAASPVLDVVLDTTNPVVAATAATAHQYGTFTGTVGTITDLHADGTATINWGDGQSSAATLVATSNPNVYDIQGTHVYQSTGSFSISITASDAAGNSASTSTSGSVTVTPPAPVVTAINVSANEGQVLTSIPVASFTNGAPSPTASEFSATINWGDGSAATTGTIVPDPSNAGSFLVEGSHTYTDGPNSYTITITVNATGVANPSTGTGTATIANVAPAVTLGGNVTGFINQIITLPITAIDPSGPDAAAGFAYVINWGDGNSQTIAAAANNGTGQAPTHVYSTAGNYTITVTATDKDGGVGTATKALQIAVAPTLSNVVINNGEAQRSHIDTVSFTLTSPSVPITSLDTSEMALVFDGSTVVPLTNATVTFNAATGQASVNLTGVTLANGDYQLFVFPGTGVLPINFTKLTGDTNGDGFVTKTDVNTVKADLGAHSGQSNYNVNADINGDGVVNSTDQSLLRLDKKAKLTTKVIKLLAGKVIKPVNLSFAAIATNATRALPIVLELENADPSRPLTISGVSLLGGGSNFSFAVLNQPYGASSFTIPAGGTLTIRMYFTPSGPGKFSTQLKAELSNDVQATYGAVIAKFKAAAVAPKKS